MLYTNCLVIHVHGHPLGCGLCPTNYGDQKHMYICSFTINQPRIVINREREGNRGRETEVCCRLIKKLYYKSFTQILVIGSLVTIHIGC